ncbi:MAG: glycosyltransferase [Candidatus Lokiarchaeota archaeon]|nr:glycosyltransferase [Candidatus Lokiarchaeota archaeon]
MGRRVDTTVIVPKRGEIHHTKGLRTRNYRIIQTAPTGKSPYKIIQGQLGFMTSMIPYIEDSSILHLFEPFHLGGGVLVTKLLTNSKFILTLIGSTTYDPYTTTHKRFAKYMKYIMKYADVVTASTEELAQRGHEQGYEGEIEIIPHCVETKRFSPVSKGEKEHLRKKLGWGSEDQIVLAIQRLHPRKRTSQLILSAEKVLATDPNVKFIIGGKGREMEKLQQLVQHLDIEDSVKLVGYVPDRLLPEYYAAADLFAFHTLYEGFGIVVIEAMSSGLPVVTTNVGGLSDIVERNQAGRVVEPNNPTMMAEAILETLDRKKNHMLSKNARDAAIQKYSIEKVCNQYQKLYEI